jgi:feruloyl-CoA synthase
VRFVDPADVNKGFLFDGRFSEDFKLATGTWVSVGPLRARILSFFAPFVRDVVITGHDRDDVGMMIFANVEACCALCPGGSLKAGADSGLTASGVLRHEAVRERFRSLLAAFAVEATGSSNRVSRAILLEEPPSLDAREITDKGSLNQRAVLEHRAALVEELYGSRGSEVIFRLEGKNDGKR